MAQSHSCTLTEARAAKEQALAIFQSLAPVVGVGVTKIGDGYGLKVNLQAPPPEGTSLPGDVDGVPVRVEVVGLPKTQ
jgi:hypothetical protein